MREALVFLALLLAGCASSTFQPAAPPTPVTDVALTLDGVAAAPSAALTWAGRTLTFSTTTARTCEASNCEQRHLTVAPLPPGRWTLQVGLDWAASHEENTGDGDAKYPSFELALKDKSGGIVAEHQGTKFGNRVALEDPAPGDYTIEVRISHFLHDFQGYGQGLPFDPFPTAATGTYAGSVLLAPTPEPAGGPLLPDLIVRNLTGLRLDYGPPGDGNGYPLFPSFEDPRSPGCTADESQETGATRCLRFSIAVGNDGMGPMLLTTDPVDTTLPTVADKPVKAYQCVADGKGGGQVRDAGTATYSASHNHMHYDRILAYDLYKHDEAAHTRGEHVAKGAKLGYGPYPEAMVHDGLRLAADIELGNPCKTDDWPWGLSSGWYDYYMWWRTGQYLDVAGVPDGVYELVVEFNPEHHVLESDVTNNAGSVVLKLAGNKVETLIPFAWKG